MPTLFNSPRLNELKLLFPVPNGSALRIVTPVLCQTGRADSCMDPELQQIDNSLIDDISHVINEEYDKLFEIETDAKGE